MALTRPVVYSGLSDPTTHAPGILFRSWDIWIAMRVPQRSLYIQKVQQNGGRVVPLEKNAHILIVDHMRRDVPPGSFSFKWIDECISNAAIVDKTPFLAGPSHNVRHERPVGALTAPKTGRNPFTAEDDRVLYAWVMAQQNHGEAVRGNEIYKQLEQQNPRHPWQSWRDRFVKYLSRRPPTTIAATATTTVSQETPLTPPSDHDPQQVENVPRATESSVSEQKGVTQNKQNLASSKTQPANPPNSQLEPEPQNASASRPETATTPTLLSLPKQSRSRSERRSSTPRQGQMVGTPETSAEAAAISQLFTNADHQYLLENASDIQNVPVGKYESMWEDLNLAMPSHSADEWREYYELVVLPEWKGNPDNLVNDRLPNESSPLGRKNLAADVGMQQSLETSLTQKRKRNEIRDQQDPTKRVRGHSPHVNFSVVVDNTPAHPSSSELAAKSSQSSGFKAGISTANHEVVDIDAAETVGATDRSNLTETSLSDREMDEHQGQFHVSSFAPVPQLPDQPEFGVYEDVDLPEEEKENLVVDESGSFSIPPRHVHVRSAEALDAFSDPLPLFILQDNGSDHESALHEDEFILHGDEDETQIPELPEIPEIENKNSATARGAESQGFIQESETLFISDDSGEDVQSMVEEVERDIDDENEDDDDDDDYEQMEAPEASNRDIFNDDLQAFLDVPPPPTSDPVEEVDVEVPANAAGRHYTAAAETQDILNAETQYADLSVPLLPSSPDIPSSPPRIPPSHPTISRITVREELRNNPGPRPQSPLASSPHPSSHDGTQAQPSKADVEFAELTEFVARQEALGHQPHDIVFALQRTSGNEALMLQILDLIKRGKPIPQGVKGIWTHEDDAVARGGTAREIERLEKLHGKQALDHRLDWLQKWEDGQDDNDDDDV